MEKAFKSFTRPIWITHKDQSRQAVACFADTAFVDYFSFVAVEGNTREILRRPASAMVTRSFAKRLLGDVDPIGQTVSIDYKWGIKGEWVIHGLLEEHPGTTTSILAPGFITVSLPVNFHDWRRRVFWSWVVLEEGADPTIVEASLRAILPRFVDPERVAKSALGLQPLSRIHLHSLSDYGIRLGLSSSGDIHQLYLFVSAGALLLLIVAANFVNLTTAQASARGLEVGVRKAIGATRHQLIAQFLIESLLITCLAAAVALATAHLIHGSLTSYLNIDLPPVSGLIAFLDVVVIALVQALFSCAYPSMVLSALRPAAAFSKVETPGSGRIGRKGLVVFQFAISALLMMSTLAMSRQMALVQEQDLGFDKALLVKLKLFWADFKLWDRAEEVRHVFEQLPGVINASASQQPIGGWGEADRMNVHREDRPDEQIRMDYISSDAGFMDTFGLEMIEGTNFREGVPHPVCILNEKAVRALGYYSKGIADPSDVSPVGTKLLVGWSGPREIIGVVRDFQHGSLHRGIAPLVFINGNQHAYLTVRIVPDRVPETLAHLERGWKRFLPDKPFVYEFVDEWYEGFYARETAMSRGLSLTAGLAIFTACLGVLGLAAFVVRQRVKEVGVRRVLGASESSIFVLLSSDFIRLAVIANAIAIPVAWYALDRWLRNFAYRISLEPSIFVLGTLAGLFFALAAVAWQATSAARMNPVDALRVQ